jgi:DNA polymerase III psi subunit
MSLLPIIEYESPEIIKTLFQETLYKMDYLNPVKEIFIEGDNRKNILIIVSAPFPTADEALLYKILKSIQLEKTDIHLLKVDPKFPLGFQRIIKIFNPSKLLFFGAEAGFLNIPESWNKYSPLELGGTSFLLADSLSALESDPGKTLKNKLWTQLKILFLPE